MGLYNLYKCDEVVKKYVKCLLALSYVARDRISETFYDIKHQSDFPIALEPLYSYFQNTYIGNGSNVRFPVSIWNYGNVIDTNVPRTNNGIEGWHSCFKKTFGSARYSFLLLLEKLKYEEDAIRIKAIRQENGEELIRKEKYVLNERATNEYLLQNQNINYGVSFIFGLLRLLHYE
jgi:hypothetical protein